MSRRELLASVVIYDKPVPLYEPPFYDVFNNNPWESFTWGLLNATSTNTPNVWANKTPVEILADINSTLIKSGWGQPPKRNI